MRAALLTTTVFAILVAALLGALPLWLDEILQLLETRGTSAPEMISHLPRNSGAAPLGYLVQQASLRITGYGVRRARIPAAVFGILSVFAVALLAREMGLLAREMGPLAREMRLKRAWLAAILFAAFPQTFRYATEARVYSQGLFFSILATLLYLRLVKKPSWTASVWFGLAQIAAIYTQPYTVFVGLALVLWSAICAIGERYSRGGSSAGHGPAPLNRIERGDPSQPPAGHGPALYGGVAFGVACAAFLPWYLWAKGAWSSGIAQQGFHFSLSAKTLLMVFRESAGAGYWGSGLLLILFALAIAKPSDGTCRRTLLVLLIAVPVAGALTADAAAGYFIAARQFLWILPAAAIFAGMALEPVGPSNRPSLVHRRSFRRTISLLAVVALIGVCVRQSIVFFRAPHEDWDAAANAIVHVIEQSGASATSGGACVEVAPAESIRLYEFFRPEIAGADCTREYAGGRAMHRIVLAITPVTSAEQRNAAIVRLKSPGYALESETAAGLSGILVFRRNGIQR